jgi:hypothetical protein
MYTGGAMYISHISVLKVPASPFKAGTPHYVLYNNNNVASEEPGTLYVPGFPSPQEFTPPLFCPGMRIINAKLVPNMS